MIRRYEEISMNAWPAIETMLYDGWVLRFANGYTRRANSINPIYTSAVDVGTKISRCEKIYARKRLHTIFKMTTDVCPPDLDSVLEDNDYTREAETSVQILTLDSVKPEADDHLEISCRADDPWLDAFFRMSGADVKHRRTLSSILQGSEHERCFVRIRYGGSIVACGVGVMEDNTVGLFDIIVDEQLRGRGLGKAVTERILAWAKGVGAETAYLQVMIENNVAISLYRKLGFSEIYRYWYRVGTSL